MPAVDSRRVAKLLPDSDFRNLFIEISFLSSTLARRSKVLSSTEVRGSILIDTFDAFDTSELVRNNESSVARLEVDESPVERLLIVGRSDDVNRLFGEFKKLTDKFGLDRKQVDVCVFKLADDVVDAFRLVDVHARIDLFRPLDLVIQFDTFRLFDPFRFVLSGTLVG